MIIKDLEIKLADVTEKNESLNHILKKIQEENESIKSVTFTINNKKSYLLGNEIKRRNYNDYERKKRGCLKRNQKIDRSN